MCYRGQGNGVVVVLSVSQRAGKWGWVGVECVTEGREMWGGGVECVTEGKGKWCGKVTFWGLF